MTLSTRNANQSFTPTLKRSTITAVFPDRAEARHVINDLRAFGLRLDQISVAMRDRRQQDQLITDTGARAATGAANGAAVKRPDGGLRGFFNGRRSNAPAAEAASGPTGPGGMIGVLMDMQIPEAEARKREAAYHLGSVLISANVFEEVAEAEGIMLRHRGGMVHRGS